MTVELNSDKAPVGVVDILATMDRCTKCGICQSHCPVMAATSAFPGPKYAGPQAARFRVMGVPIDHSTDLCTGCGICSTVCPNEVAISDIITIARGEGRQTGSSSPLGQWLLNRPDLIGTIGGGLPALANAALKNRPLRYLVEKLLGIHRNARLPTFRGSAFRDWFDAHPQPDGSLLIYFPGCAVDNFDPETGISTIRVLNRLGYRIAVTGRYCCSLPMLSTGEWEVAKSRAKQLVVRLGHETQAADHMVASSTSCALTLKSKYAAYLDMKDTATIRLASRVRDVCQLIRDAEPNFTVARSMKLRVLYHPPCQLRSHGIGLPALELLRGIPDLNVIVSEASCCGVGGTYGYDRRKYDISKTIGLSLIDQVRRASVDLIVCDSETCRWHLEAMSGVRAIHPIQLLDMALDEEVREPETRRS